MVMGMERQALAWQFSPMSSFPFARRHPSAVQLFRYALLGVASNLAGYFAYLILTSLGSAPRLTMTLLYGIGAAIGFIGNRKLTFVDKGSVSRSGARYLAVHLFGYLINLSILFVFIDKLGYPHQLAQAIAIFVVASLLFFAFRRFVFRDPDTSSRKS
jgi:putative flippase GtrA